MVYNSKNKSRTKRKRFFSLTLAVLLLLATLLSFSACGKKKEKTPPEEEESPVDVVDTTEYPVLIGDTEILSRPDRVVSLAASITEKIFDLGLEDSLVGVSNYCKYPPAAAEYPICGTSQIPQINAILETGATTVISTAPLPELDAEALEERDVQLVVLPQAQSLAEIWDIYTDLAMLLEGKESGEQIARDKTEPAKAWLDNLKNAIQQVGEEEIPAIYIKKLNFTVATGDSVEQELMEILGLTNIAAEYTDWFYPEMEASEGQGLAAFQSLEMMLFDEKDLTMSMLEQNAFYKGLPATIADKYITVDSSALERQSFSMLSELSDIANTLWEEADLPAWTGEPVAQSTTQQETDDTDKEETDSEETEEESSNATS